MREMILERIRNPNYRLYLERIQAHMTHRDRKYISCPKNPELEKERMQEWVDKKRKEGRYPVDYDFNLLNDADLHEAYTRLVRRSAIMM